PAVRARHQAPGGGAAPRQGPAERPPARARRLDVTATDLVALTAELVATPSVSRSEGPLADRVQEELARCPWLQVERIGNNGGARPELGRRQRVVLAGHLDTVPAAGEQGPRREGDVVWGVGSADMKGGLAVMLDLARSLPEPAVDVTWCFYPCEEVDR